MARYSKSIAAYSDVFHLDEEARMWERHRNQPKEGNK